MKALDEFLSIYERWERDPDSGNDAGWMGRIAYVAIREGLPIYEDGVADAGAAGWRRLAARYEGGDKRNEETGKRNTGYQDLPLPWVAAG